MGEPTNEPCFDADPELYDALIDWPKRLEREGPFYQELFRQAGVRSVLDAACGTGRHARMFNSWGLRVEGADGSAAMIDYCRRRWGESQTLCWRRRSFDQPSEPAGAYDAVLCVGNSLSLAPRRTLVPRVLAALLASLRPGGVGIIHVLNLWRLPQGPTTWHKCKRLQISGRDMILLKGLHRSGSRGYVDFGQLILDGGSVVGRFAGPAFFGLEADQLLSAARAGGAKDLQLFGDYQRSPYDRRQSEDLILLCRRGD